MTRPEHRYTVRRSDQTQGGFGRPTALPRRLIELGLQKAITWQQAEALLDAYEADEADHESRSALLAAVAGPDAARPSWRLGERDLALAVALAEGDRPRPDLYPAHWHGAIPEEAFLFNLSVLRNPGDHSNVPGLTGVELREELAIASVQSPPTAWLAARTAALTEELYQREQRRTDVNTVPPRPPAGSP